MMIYVISNTDGDTHVTTFTERAFLQALNDGEYGDCTFLSETPTSDTNEWGSGILVLQGGVIIPTPCTIVTTWAL